MSSFKIKRSGSKPRELEVTGYLPSGHEFSLLVSPWAGFSCTDVPDIHASFLVELHPDFVSDDNDARTDAAISETTVMEGALDERLRPLVDSVVEAQGTDEAATRSVVRLGLALALGRFVREAEVDAAIEADGVAFVERREAHDRPIGQAIWEEAQEHEQGLRM